MAGKRVLVTGASMGIGEQFAYELAKLKAHVIIVARSKDKMERIVKKCTELGAPSARYLSVDLSTKEESVLKKIIDDSVSMFGGGLDMLILNHLSPSDVTVQKDWSNTFMQQGLPWLVDQYYLNVFSYFYLGTYALPILEKNNGKLIVVSSMSGVLGLGISVGYSSQKHAINGYFESLRADLRHKKKGPSITICILGAIGTDALMTTGVANSAIPVAPADQCAREIIAGGQLGHPTVWYPYNLVRPATLLQPFFPQFLEDTASQAVAT